MAHASRPPAETASRTPVEAASRFPAETAPPSPAERASPFLEQAAPLHDAWPWRCLGCEDVIYHDAEYCRDCRRPSLPPRIADTRHPVAAFLDWIRREPYPSFLTKVTAVASLELSLTALWLQLMLVGSVWLGRLPGVV